MDVTGATQIGVIDDGAGAGGGPGGFVVGKSAAMLLQVNRPISMARAEMASARSRCRSRYRRRMPRHVRKPCSGCDRFARMAMISPSVCGPIEAAHRRKQSGVHSAYRRWTGHALRVCAVAPAAIAALVNGNALATVEYLDRPARRADVDLLRIRPCGTE